MNMPISRSRILVINMGGIGDLLLSTGALSALRVQYPSARIDLLCTGRAASFMRAYGLFTEVITFPGTIAGIAAMARSLRTREYDLALNMRTIVTWASAAKMYALIRAVGARETAGRDTDGKGFFFDIRVREPYISRVPEYYYDTELVRAVGATVHDGAPLALPIAPQDRAVAQALLSPMAGMEREVLIGVHPGGVPTHRWQEHRFVALINDLLRTVPAKVILTGGPGEADLCERIAQRTGAVSLAGKTPTVGSLGALMQRCRIFISNDTGAMHVCVAVGTPGIFLFGPGHITRYAPFKDPERHTVLRAAAPCAPCERTTCPRPVCMDGISVEAVRDAVMAALKRTQA